MSLQAAFDAICASAKPSKAYYVSLYERIPFYGGPEEGGWWGEDVMICASQKFLDEKRAKDAVGMIQELAEQETARSKRDFYNQCAAECDWLEKRGLEPDFLREVDGNSEFFVVMEDAVGSLQHRQERGYS